MLSAYSNMGARPIILCGPSGTGKSVLLKRLFKDFPTGFGFSVSHTTRKPRPGETNGQHYHFVERSIVDNLIKENGFMEHAEFAGNVYGTSFAAVRHVLNDNRSPILDIDMQGVIQLQERTDIEEKLGARPLYIFIAPPSLEELRRRLSGRGTETKESLESRLKIAEAELAWGLREGSVDKYIVNDNLDTAYEELKEAIFSS